MSIDKFRAYYNAAQAVGLEEDVRLGRLRREAVPRRRKEGEIDGEEMECLLANMIYKVRRRRSLPLGPSAPRCACADVVLAVGAQNLLKGYISHAHQLVVLSKDKPFPWCVAPCLPFLAHSTLTLERPRAHRYPPYRNKGEAFARQRAERETQERQRVVDVAAAAGTGAAPPAS